MTASDEDSSDKSSSEGKISVLRPAEAALIQSALRMYHEQVRTDPPPQILPPELVNPDDPKPDTLSASVVPGLRGNESPDLANCVVGLALMLAGLATIVIVTLLPFKSAGWIFIVAGVFFLFGGAYRIDKATKPFQRRMKTSRSEGVHEAVDKTAQSSHEGEPPI
jgi:hypothetical protein